MKPLTIKITTLTPLWTGGVKMTTDRLHETGIIGSLRWWYEVIVRGLGGKACDPTADGCKFNKEGFEKAKREGKDEQEALDAAKLCDVCRVFGATGWQRRFRVEVVDTNLVKDELKGQFKADRSYVDARGKRQTPKWYFKGPGLIGDLTVRLIPSALGFDIKMMAGLVKLVAAWGTLGARAHLGFGVLRLSAPQPMRPLLDHFRLLVGPHTYPSLPSLSSLRNLFLARIQVDTNRFQETLNLIYDLRRCFASNKNLCHFVMGTTRGQRLLASKIKVSRPYDQEGKKVIRVWGWIPENLNFGASQDDVLKIIHGHTQAKYTLGVWREFGSGLDASGKVRDSTGKVYTDPYEFLCSLVV